MISKPAPVPFAPLRLARPEVIVPRPRSQTPPSQEEIRAALMAQLAHLAPLAPVNVELFVFRIETAIRLGVLDDAGRRYLFKKNLMPADDLWVGQVLKRLGYGVE